MLLLQTLILSAMGPPLPYTPVLRCLPPPRLLLLQVLAALVVCVVLDHGRSALQTEKHRKGHTQQSQQYVAAFRKSRAMRDSGVFVVGDASH